MLDEVIEKFQFCVCKSVDMLLLGLRRNEDGIFSGYGEPRLHMTRACAFLLA